MMRREDLGHVIIEPLPKSSHLYIKSNVPDKNGRMEYYENLLQVTIRSTGIILNLDLEPVKGKDLLMSRLCCNRNRTKLLCGEPEHHQELNCMLGLD